MSKLSVTTLRSEEFAEWREYCVHRIVRIAAAAVYSLSRYAAVRNMRFSV
jgi:hypothetical protein